MSNVIEISGRVPTVSEKKIREAEEKTETSVETTETATAETRRKKKSRKKVLRRIIVTVIVLAILGVGGWIAYSKLRADYQVTYDPYTATTGSISNSLSFSGTMQLINSTSYTASADQKVKDVYVSAGDTVKEGQKLMRLSGGETLTAEFDGTVSSVDVAAGDAVKNGDSLMTVADFDHMKVSVRVGESDISTVAPGQSCKVTVSSAGANFDATIDKIDYVSYTGNNVAYYTTTVYVDTAGAEKKIYPGMQATVTVPLEEANDVIVLKMDALSTARDNTAFVYKQAEDGSMTEQPVTVGVSNGNYVEIKEGLSDGETVYKVAEKKEESSGIASVLSGLFGSQQVNQPTMPSGMPGGGSWGGGSRDGSSGFTRNSNGGGSGGSSRPSMPGGN